MKRTLLIITCLLTLSLAAKAQEEIVAVAQNKWFDLAIGFQGTQYRNFDNLTNFEELGQRSFVRIGYKHWMAKRIGLGIDASFGKIFASQVDSDIKLQQRVLDGAFLVHYKFIDLKTLDVFGSVGFGLTHFGQIEEGFELPRFGSRATIPIQLGAEYKLSGKLNLVLQASFKKPISDLPDYLHFSAGISINLNKGKFKFQSRRKEAKLAALAEDSIQGFNVIVKLTDYNEPTDLDSDGIVNSKDKCPLEAGTIANGGCPDPSQVNSEIETLKEKNALDSSRLAGKTRVDQLINPTDSMGKAKKAVIDKETNQSDKVNLVKQVSTEGKMNALDSIRSEDKIQLEEEKLVLDGRRPEEQPATDTKNLKPEDEGVERTDKNLSYADNKSLVRSNDEPTENSGSDPNTLAFEIEKETRREIRIALSAQKIQLDTNSDILRDSTKTFLDEVAELMLVHVAFDLIISGHADRTGPENFNMYLSRKRANQVKQYLIDLGVEEDRLFTRAFGEEMPIASNATAIGRAKNRRVSFELIFK